MSSTSLYGENATLDGLAGDQHICAKCVGRYSLLRRRTISVNIFQICMERTLESHIRYRFSGRRMGGTMALLLAAYVYNENIEGLNADFGRILGAGGQSANSLA